MTKILRTENWRQWFSKAKTPENTNGTREVCTAPPAETANGNGGREVDKTDLIQERAYFLWRSEGCPAGRDMYYWLRAEEEFRAVGSPEL